ncbi:hypothetical protein Tco_1577641 [Tanacetum coccineum]
MLQKQRISSYKEAYARMIEHKVRSSKGNRECFECKRFCDDAKGDLEKKVKAKQEKGMFEYSTDLNTNQDEDTSCAWKKISYAAEYWSTVMILRCGMFHDQGSNKEDPWRQQQVIEGCRDKEKKGFHVLVFQTEAGFLDRQQESIKEFLRILEVHVSIAV